MFISLRIKSTLQALRDLPSSLDFPWTLLRNHPLSAALAALLFLKHAKLFPCQVFARAVPSAWNPLLKAPQEPGSFSFLVAEGKLFPDCL